MAILDCLDLLVTVDTSVGHLARRDGPAGLDHAGAAPDWRWLLDRSDTPWYPTVRLFRQGVPRQWQDVFAAVANGVNELFAGEIGLS